jgi:hypothetical protein
MDQGLFSSWSMLATDPQQGQALRFSLSIEMTAWCSLSPLPRAIRRSGTISPKLGLAVANQRLAFFRSPPKKAATSSKVLSIGFVEVKVVMLLGGIDALEGT